MLSELSTATAGSTPWNNPQLRARPLLHDETLRDGLQNPSVVDPSFEQKLEIVRKLDGVGVDSVNIGLPAAGPRAFDDVVRLAKAIVDEGLRIRPGCAARTLRSDIEPIAKASQAAGVPLEVMTFIGSSPIRQYVERWDVDFIRETSVKAIAFAVGEALPVTYVTEDTTRTPPQVLGELFRAAIDAGAHRLCLCDTVGHATPDGAHNLVSFVHDLVRALGVEVGIDWHGHEDRGFSLPNALAAANAGADRIHGCILGVGERVGNTSLEMLVRHYVLEGIDQGLSPAGVEELCALVFEATQFPPRPDHPYLRRRQPT